MKFDYGRLDVYDGSDRRYCGLVLTGSELAQMRSEERALTDQQLMQNLQQLGAKPSRLDVCINLHTDAPIDDLIDAQKDGRLQTKSKDFRVMDNLGDGSKTVYVGSRQSELMLRAYDKAIESGNLDQLWTRLELEAKAETAQAIGRVVASDGCTALEAWWRRFDFEVSWYDDTLKNLGNAADYEKMSHKADSDKWLWLQTQVLPALKKIKQLEPKTYEMFLDEIAKMEGLLP
jgi:hypothetical protein